MTTEERIDKLEEGLASARRLNRWLLAAVGLALSVWILSGNFGRTMLAMLSGGGAVKEVWLREFILEDENGKDLSIPGVTKDGPAMLLFDENCKPRAVLCASENGTRLTLGVTKDEPALTLYDKEHNARAVLNATKDGAGLVLLDEKGEAIWHAPQSALLRLLP